jgi:predicted permease
MTPGLPRALDIVVQDVRYAVRGMRRHPGFALVAVVSLAIGIGANTAIFSLVNSVLLRPLAYEDPHRLFWARESSTQFQSMPVNPLHALTWASECRTLEQVALMRRSRAQLVSGGEPVTVRGARVPHNVFALLGIQPILGRAFLASEEQEGRDRVAILAESIWRSNFNADPSLVGRTVQLDGEPHEVVGVVPESFRLPLDNDSGPQFEIYRPLVLSPTDRSRPTGNFNFAAVVRIKRGITVDQALADMNVVLERFRRPTGYSQDLTARLVPVHELRTGRARLGLWMLAAAVGAVLLIVCVNLANLSLSRIAARSREAAIRTALGATRARQFSQVLTESLLLAVAGGGLGLLLAAWSLRFLVGSTSVDLPRLDEVRLDLNVLLTAIGLTLAAGLLSGVLPAWRFTRHEPQAALRAGSHTVTDARGGLRLRETLIGLEVAVGAALLIVAALLTSSLTRLLQVDKGFNADRVAAIDIDLAGSRYEDEVNRERFFDRLLASVATVSGVEAAGIVTQLPILGENWNDPIYLEGAPPDERHPVNNRYTSPRYFRAMGIAMLRGRAFEENDRGQGVAVLSEKAARLLWPGDPNPVGRMFMGEDDKIKTLVGIVADVRAELHVDAPAHAYYPYWQRVPGDVTLVVRTAADLPAVTGALRVAIRSADAQLPIPAFRTMDEVVYRSVVQRRFQAMLMAAFAASALLVASLGIYGVVSYSVARRRNEIGIRMALGAQRSSVLGLIVRQGMTPVVIGLAAGVGSALVVGRAIRGLLFEIQPTDPAVIAAVTVVLFGVGILACILPARRAAGVDAVVALRAE